MIKRRVTELNAVLADWDEAKLPNGQDKYFSVAFVSKKGEFRFVKRGRKTGLRMHMKDNDMKAVQPVDTDGMDIGHVYPVWIHSIIFYSGNVVMNLLKNGN
ncbi:MAG: hypothetical protein P1P88_01240 [Bacteroidales bacterium]|nr:hypothetical protein [Bacteroidales bacterium]